MNVLDLWYNDTMKMNYTYYLSTPYGMQSTVKNQCRQLDVQVEEVGEGFVIVKGSLSHMALLNMSLRTASTVFLVLKEFEAKDFDTFFDELVSFDFHEILGAKDQFPVEAQSYRSQLSSVPAIQRVGKKAIATSLMNHYGLNQLPETGRVMPIQVRIFRDKVRVLLDTTGESLHKRGYRLEGVQAPLRENFAAALLSFTRYYGKGDLIDPLCGSGTIPIEAAMIARRIAPGLQRNFLFESWGLLNQREVINIKEKLKSQVLPEAEFKIFASDYNRDAVEVAKANAKRAGVLQDMVIEQRALKDCQFTSYRATVVTNMPYGKRISSRERLDVLEKEFNELILSREDWTVGILSSNHYYPFPKNRKPEKVRKLYNGPLETYFYVFQEIRRKT